MSVDSNRRRISGLLICVAMVTLVVVFWGTISRWWIERAFALGDLRRFEEVVESGSALDVASEEIPTRRGKVLLVRPSVWKMYRRGNRFRTQVLPKDKGKLVKEIDPPQLDHSFFDLDSSLRASSPDEVSTLIFVEYQEHVVGTYVPVEGPGPTFKAKRKGVTLHVFDWRERRHVGTFAISGSDPRYEVTLWESHSGDLPNVAAFVEQEMPEG